MKILVALILAVFVSPLAFAQSDPQQAEAYYQKGLAAEKAGDPSTASAAYNAALKIFPSHANARYRAGQVKINASDIKSAALEAKIGAVIIPVYEIEDASIQESIELLSLVMNKAGNGETAPNFIIDDPKNKLAETRITMRLKNIPVKAILSYLHSQANTKARYDEHAVVITAR